MLVADIVKTVNQRESVNGLQLHGVVRSIINTPEEYKGIVLSSGEFAVLDLYAVTCKQENMFGHTKPTMLSPQGSVIFVLEDMSLVGKLVTVKGPDFKGYAKLRKQKSENKVVGFNCLEFRKSTGPNWVVVPNTVVEFTGTEDKEITDYLLESKQFGFNYLDFTKKYLSFCGSTSYETKDIVEVGQTNHSHFSTSFTPTWESDLDDLKNKVYSAKELSFSASESECLFTHYANTLLNKVLAYNEDAELQYRLIPHTNSRFAEVVPRGSVRDYLSLLGILLKSNFTSISANLGLSKDKLERILGYCPHYLYLKGELPFELAEKIFYLNGETDCNSLSVYYRNISLIVEGAKSKYRKDGTTYLLATLTSNLTCKVPQELRENIKTTGTPLSKEEFSFVRYFLESLPQYEVNSTSMYYTVESSERNLGRAKDLGLIIDLGRSYVLTEFAEMELSVLDKFARLQESRIDYSDSALDQVLSTLKDERDVLFSNKERQAFLTLNSNIGLVMANGVSNKEGLEEAFHLMSLTESSTILDTVVVVKDYDTPSWVHSREVRVVRLSELNENNLGKDTMVIVHDANTWSLEDYYKLVQYDFKSLYLFGNPYTSSNYFRTLALALPRAYTFAHTNLDIPLNITNNGYLISLKGSKKVTFKNSPKLSTIDVLLRMVKTAFESGYSFENMYVISDLEKHFSAYRVSKKLVELLGYKKELTKGNLVYLEDGKLAWVVSLDGDSIIVLKDGMTSPIKVSLSKVIPALCVTSDVAIRSPKDIAYVIAQRGYGDYYRDDVYNSLDSANKGVAFIGEEEYITTSHFRINEPKITILKKRLLK